MDIDEEIRHLLSAPPATLDALIDGMTSGLLARLKTAVELGKWRDGSRLSHQQLEHCMQAIILYESRHLPEQERTGAPLQRSCSSASAAAEPVTVQSTAERDSR